MTTRLVGCVVAAIAAALLGAACGATGPSASPLKLDNGDNGKAVTVAVGQALDVSLQTIGPGEYEAPSISSSAVRFLSVSQVAPPVPAGETQLYKFEASGPGRASIVIAHTTHSPTFTLTIDVR